MEERRKDERRQGPIRLTERRRELDESKVRVARSGDRRKADRRIGIDRRRHRIDGNQPTTGSA